MVSQFYDTDVNKAYVIRGNAAVLKCEIPSFVADFVSVVSWHTDKEETFVPATDYGLCGSKSPKKNKNIEFLYCLPPIFFLFFISMRFHQVRISNFHVPRQVYIGQCTRPLTYNRTQYLYIILFEIQ